MDPKEYLDSNGLLFLWTKLKALFSYKVDKVDGKQLSTEDYTTEEKQKLSTMTSVVVDDEEPTDESVNFWVDTSQNEDIASIPEVRDTEISSGDTWSSQKISDEISKVSSDVDAVVSSIENEDTFTVIGNPVQFDMIASLPLEMSTTFAPKQDLKWGAPWPGGAGKNLLNIESLLKPDGRYNLSTDTSVDVSGTTLTLSGTPTGAYGQIQENNIIDPVSLVGKTVTLSGKLGGDEPYFAVQFKSATSTLKTLALANTGSASIVVPEGTTKIALAVCLNTSGYINTACTATYTDMQLELGSTATSFAPYANTPPIEGRTGLNAFAGGKNLCGSAEDIVVQNGPSKATMTQNGNVFTLSTTSEYGGDGFFFGYGVFKKGKKYTVSGTVAGYVNVRIYDKTNMNAWLHLITPDTNGNFAYTFEATSDDVVFRIWVSASAECILSNFQIEEGDLTPYAPYQGNTYALDFGEEVYGGIVDWNAGEMVVDRGIFVHDGTHGIYKFANQTITGYTIFDVSWLDYTPLLGTDRENPNFVSNYFKSMSIQELVFGDIMTGCGIAASKTSGGIYFRFPNEIASTPEEVTALFKEKPLVVSYKLAEPYTIKLTPHELESLKGINTIYGDGEITVSGKNSVLAKIDSVKGNLENAIEKIGNTSASRTYTLGEIKTNDIWVDGSPIYRNILEITGTNTAGESLSIPLGNFKFGHLILLDGGFFSGEDYCHLATTHNSSTTANVYTRIRYATTAPELRIVCGSGRSIGSGYAIIEYTKTTD